MSKPITYYEPIEEKLNVITHAIGLIASVLALVFLLFFTHVKGSLLHLISFGIFGVSLVILYAASTFYHSSQNPTLRRKLNIFDHASIYILIAGTYTPFTLITLNGLLGWTIFGISWSLAVVGIVFKLFYTGRFNLLSTLAYVLMGWMMIIAIKPLINNLAYEGLIWLFAGGAFYTIGAVLYAFKKLRFNHAIFHVFVLLGSFSHFMAIFGYVR